jgi:hypothetical protein
MLRMHLLYHAVHRSSEVSALALLLLLLLLLLLAMATATLSAAATKQQHALRG